MNGEEPPNIEKILGLNIFNINASYDKNDNMKIDNIQNVKGDSIENENTVNDFNIEIKNESSRINDIDKNGNIIEERESSPKISDDGEVEFEIENDQGKKKDIDENRNIIGEIKSSSMINPGGEE